MAHTKSQRYQSTRGGSYDFSFEQVVLKGLASDGGLFIPEEIPSLPPNWQSDWQNLSFEDLALRIFSLYISPDEIPTEDLKEVVRKSYGTFRAADITPTIALDKEKNLYLLELFHGPTFAFKDVALQFLGNLFEYFLVRRNRDKTAREREHLTVIGATSGDTGSAAIYGLRGKQDVSVFIMFPTGKVSPVQEAQMTTVSDANVHCLSVDGTFDDCQDFVKALFADSVINQTHKLAAVNSINWARILAQITYYFASYFQLLRKGVITSESKLRVVVPTGNFGDILAGYFATHMGLSAVEKLVIATNENDILHRFWKSGTYEKHEAQGDEFAHEDGAKETLSPAMDILISSNFERLLWFLTYRTWKVDSASDAERRTHAGVKVKGWLQALKEKGGFAVEPEVLKLAQQEFQSERVSDEQTIETIRDVFGWPGVEQGDKACSGYVLDPHSAVGVAASLRSVERVGAQTVSISLSTAHPAKFSKAVELALSDVQGFQFNSVLPPELSGLESLPRKVLHVKKDSGLEGVRKIVVDQVEAELQSLH